MRIFASLLMLIFANSTFAQSLCINNSDDTLDAEMRQAFHFYESYLSEFKGTSLPDFKKYWSPADCNTYQYPDQMIYAISGDYPTYSMGTERTVLYIKPDRDTIHIKTLFAWVDSLDHITALCITNHYIRFDGNRHPFFVNPIQVNMRKWQSRKVRNITYFFPSYHSFNAERADSLIHNVEKMEKDWGLKPIDIRYYFANTKEEIQKMRGFDYSIDMGNRNKPSGISDDRDNLVYCGGLGENYFHEVAHIYLNRLYPESPLQEGLAVFYGGSMGYPLKWHLKRLDLYLQQHPEVDLSNPDAFYYMDNYTNPSSTIKGLLCQLGNEKDGMAGLKRMMSYKSLPEIFEKEYGVTKETQNNFLRKMIHAQAL